MLVWSFAVYAPSLGNHFALDDGLVAKAWLDADRPNPMIRELQPLGAYFRSNYWAGRGMASPLYRPVTILSYAWTHRLFDGQSIGAEAFPHHLINVLLHMLAVWLVYRLLRAVSCPRALSVIGALVFALHAIHSEVVATIVGRAELLGFCFGAGALLFGVRGLERSWPKALPRFVAAALLFFLAFCSKENALAWAAFLPVFLGARRRTAARSPRIFWTSTLPLGAVLLWLVLRTEMIQGLASEPEAIGYLANPLAFEEPLARITTAVAIWGYGLYKTLLPFSLAGEYGPPVFPILHGIFKPRFLAAALVLLAVFALSIRVASRRPLCFLGMATFLGFGFLTSNVPLAIGTIFAERLYYTPSLGLSFVAVDVLGRLQGPAARRAGHALLATWLLFCSGVILARNPVWKDDASFYTREARNQPRSASLNLNASEVHRLAGRDREWRQHLERAVELLPGYVEAWNNLGLYHLGHRSEENGRARLEESLRCFREARASPFFAAGIPELRAVVLYNLARTLVLLDRVGEAREPIEQALRAHAWTVGQRLGEFLELSAGRHERSWLHRFLRQGRESAPGQIAWRIGMGRLAFEEGRLALAEAEFREALSIASRGPERAPLHLALAEIAMRRGKRDVAARELELALAADPTHAPARRLQARLAGR